MNINMDDTSTTNGLDIMDMSLDEIIRNKNVRNYLEHKDMDDWQKPNQWRHYKPGIPRSQQWRLEADNRMRTPGMPQLVSMGEDLSLYNNLTKRFNQNYQRGRVSNSSGIYISVRNNISNNQGRRRNWQKRQGNGNPNDLRHILRGNNGYTPKSNSYNGLDQISQASRSNLTQENLQQLNFGYNNNNRNFDNRSQRSYHSNRSHRSNRSNRSHRSNYSHRSNNSHRSNHSQRSNRSHHSNRSNRSRRSNYSRRSHPAQFYNQNQAVWNHQITSRQMGPGIEDFSMVPNVGCSSISARFGEITKSF